MADEQHVEEAIGEEAGAEKIKPKSIKKPTGWNSFYQSVAVSIYYWFFYELNMRSTSLPT